MATVMKTPGVYIVEKNAFPSSVVEVATAVPAFIGHTEKALNKEKSLLNQPRLITSMADYHNYFGFGPPLTYTLATDAPDVDAEAPVPAGSTEPVARAGGEEYFLVRTSARYHLYHSMLLFFQNGGGRCYVVSVGGYEDALELGRFQEGLKRLKKEQEPTMVVMPDAVLMDGQACITLQQAALKHCGTDMKSRVAILDIHGGYRARDDDPDPVAAFRNSLGVNDLDFAAAYYPWLDTTIVQESDLGIENLDDAGRGALGTLLEAEEVAEDLRTMLAAESLAAEDVRVLDKALVVNSGGFKEIVKQIQADANRLPPSGAMAGIYTMVDNARGVWKAPANVSLNAVVKPSVHVSHEEQQDLNVTPQGKSVNAIRTFIGEGTLVWGARTLDGNSLDWRYVSVRRTMIMLEQSIKLATKAYVFEPNDANTWVTIKSMIRNFLTGIWKRGGLAGASPTDAFSVHVGLGETMTSEDILEGILRVTVLVAVTRPAEFIEITFEQQMQKS